MSATSCRAPAAPDPAGGSGAFGAVSAGRCLPDKAIDLVDEACAAARIRAEQEQSTQPVLMPEDIAQVVAQASGVPAERVGEQERERLDKLEDRLNAEIVGQSRAVAAVAGAIRRSRTGLGEPGRPIGAMLFLGPTGVGKTALARALAVSWFGSEKALLKFDMSEYQEQHTAARLLGAPPGYLGHDEGGQLTEAVRRRPYSVVLFDEIEKAHPDIQNILLQILEDGQLTDAMGRKADFRNTIVLLTSNLGARFLAGQSAPLGFAAGSEAVFEKQSAQAVEEAKKWFRPGAGRAAGRADRVPPASRRKPVRHCRKNALPAGAARRPQRLPAAPHPQVGAALAARPARPTVRGNCAVRWTGRWSRHSPIRSLPELPAWGSTGLRTARPMAPSSCGRTRPQHNHLIPEYKTGRFLLASCTVSVVIEATELQEEPMHTLFLLNPTAGKADCTRTLPQQIAAAARCRACPGGIYHSGHNPRRSCPGAGQRAAQQARQSGEELRVFTAGGDGTFNEALTGLYGYAGTAVGCLPFGSGNDFLRTFGTKEEFLDLDAQLAGGAVSIDLMQTSLGFRPPSALPVWTRRWPTASPSSGASRCAAARWPMCFPLWSSCADTSAAGWSTPSTVRRWMWTA